MVKIQQTVIVGLGFFGRLTLERLKERMVSTYGELPAIKFLALDTLQTDQGVAEIVPMEGILGPTEYIPLPLDEIKNQPKQAQKKYPWLPDQVVTYGPEWYKTRAATRLAFQFHAKDII